MDFIYLFRLLLKRKWIIIGAAIIASVIAYGFTRNQPKIYRSTSQISTGYTISDEIKVNNETFSVYDADTKFNNVIVTCTSPTVMSLLSYTLILHDLESQNPFRGLNERQKQSPIYKGTDKEQAKKTFADKLETMSVLTSFKPDEKRLLEFLNLYGYDYKSIGKGLSIYRLQRTDYIQIDYYSENPELSAFVVNNIFQQFLKYYQNVRSNKSQESIDTLKSLMDKKKQELDQKIKAMGGEGAVDIKLLSGSKLDQISSLQQTLTSARTEQNRLNSELRKVNQRIANLESPSVSSNDNNELLILRRSMNDAYTAYLNSGSSDKALLNKYNQLKAEYMRKTANSNQTTEKTGESKTDLLVKKNEIEIDIQTNSNNISSIQSQISSLNGNVLREASKGASATSAEKDVELASTEYLAAKKNYTDARDVSTFSVNNFRQVLVGQPAIAPEPSKRMLIVGMAGAAAFVITILIIVLLAYLDSSVKTPGIFQKNVNLRLISLVNFMNLKQKSLADIVANKDGGDDPINKNRHNVFRESIRKLRYEVESSGKKIFLFTSTKKGMGKTTLIQALSYSLSMSKKKILIIDTNFCNNDLTVQLSADPVLETIVPNKTNGETVSEQVKKVSTDIGVGSVFVIGSEGGDYTPSEVLPRENLLHHLHSLIPEYDYIFLEGPPLNDFSDSKELAQYVDGVIAVFSATHIIKQIDKESIQFFKELNGKFCGSILNMVDLKNINVT
jgi:polysaccharide biosynthesis transport protein